MADLVIASAPQAFTFGGRELVGRLVSFTGQTKRRSVDHVFPKRDGAVVEDMGRGQRRLAVRLVFVGPSCARDYQQLVSFLSENPRGLLVHPTAGRWNAYTDGPEDETDFARALDEIQARVEFREAVLDATVARDAPDPATAAQAATDQRSKFQKAVATYLAAIAKAEQVVGRGIAEINSVAAQIDNLDAPVDAVLGAIAGVAGAGSRVLGSALLIATKSTLLADTITNYVASARDLFSGTAFFGNPSTTANLLGATEDAALDLVNALIASSPTPAGAAEASGAVEEQLAACYVLDAALKAARPPVVTFVVPRRMDLIQVAMETGDPRTATQRASQILRLNHIHDPARIPAGTSLLVPTR